MSVHRLMIFPFSIVSQDNSACFFRVRTTFIIYFNHSLSIMEKKVERRSTEEIDRGILFDIFYCIFSLMGRADPITSKSLLQKGIKVSLGSLSYLLVLKKQQLS